MEDGLTTFFINVKSHVAGNAYFHKGNLEFGQGDYQNSIKDYNNALRYGLDTATIYYMRGRAKRHLGNNISAIDDFDKLIKREPTNIPAYLDRGITWAMVGENDIAIIDYSKALSINSNASEVTRTRLYSEAYYYRAVSNLLIGKTSNFCDDLNNAQKLGAKIMPKEQSMFLKYCK